MGKFKELLIEAEVKNQIATIKKELIKRYGRSVKIIGQRTPVKGGLLPHKVAGVLMNHVNGAPAFWAQYVFDINGKILVAAKDIGSHPGLLFFKFDNKHDVDKVDADEAPHFGSSYSKTVDIDKLLEWFEEK